MSTTGRPPQGERLLLKQRAGFLEVLGSCLAAQQSNILASAECTGSQPLQGVLPELGWALMQVRKEHPARLSRAQLCSHTAVSKSPRPPSAAAGLPILAHS